MLLSTHETLKKIIIEEVYNERIQEVAERAGERKIWIMDFKGQVVDRTFLENYAVEFFKTMQENGFTNIQIGGLESAAIPLVSALTILDREGIIKNSFYIRKSRKKSGLSNLVEGKVLPDVPIILVDDIINQGSTFKKQEIILRENYEQKVAGFFVVIRFRDISYYNELIDAGTKIFSIFELDDFSKVLPVKNITIIEEEINYKKYDVSIRKQFCLPNTYNIVPKSAPILDGEFLYFGIDDGRFICIDKNTASIVWSYKVPFGSKGKIILSSPAIHKNYVFFGAYDGIFYCLDKYTGKIVWTYIEADWIGSSPCINKEKGIVYIGLEFGLFSKRGGVVALDIKTGKVLWKNTNTMTEYTHASPAYSNKYKLVVCGCNDCYFRAFDSSTGKVVWEYKTGGHIKYGAIFDEKRGLVIFGGMDGGVYILHAKDGTLYHRFEARFGFYSNPVQDDSKLFIGSLDKRVYSFDVDTKETLWTYETAGRIFATGILYEDCFLIGSNDGRLYEFNKDTGKIITIIQIPERIVNAPIIEKDKSGKRILYIPSQACEIYRGVEL